MKHIPPTHPVAVLGLILALALGLAGCATQKSSGSRSGSSEVWTGTNNEAPTQWVYDQAPQVPDGWKVREQLKQVTFAQGSSVLTREARGVMAEAVEELTKNSAWKVLVTGHADGQGETSNPNKLGLQRAEAVAANLRARGIDAERIGVQSLGSLQARAADHETQAQRQDRRVEIWAVSR